MRLSALDIENIFRRHYDSSQETLLATVLTHSELVAGKALEYCHLFPEIDLNFVFEAAMLHDIGVAMCHAPSIGAYGQLPYLQHGIEGRKILENEGLPRHALVCERHTGAGLTCREIIEHNMPLPHRDMLPLSIEEKLICYADSFFSKSGDIKREKSIEEVKEQMSKFGPQVIKRFDELHNLFNPGL